MLRLPSKSKVFATDRAVQFTLYGQNIDFVKEFKYLRCPFRFSGVDADLLITKNIQRLHGDAAEMGILQRTNLRRRRRKSRISCRNVTKLDFINYFGVNQDNQRPPITQ